VVDKSVGTAGTLRITDDGTTVRYYVLCSDPQTNIGTYRFAVNGTSGTTSLPAGFGSKLLATRSYSTSGTATLSQQATGTQGLGGAASLSASISRPKPNTPSGLSVSRVSDSQHSLSWTRNSVTTSSVIQRRTNDGAWQQIGTTSLNTVSFTDTTTQANRKYAYRVASRNAAGQSGWSNIATVYTTPSVPTGASAVRSGNNIVVSASGVPPYATSYDVRDGATLVGSAVSLPWTHATPDPAVPHTYTVRAKRGSLNSGYSSASNTVQLISPPNAPTGLTPNGGVIAANEPYQIRWAHNPVDASPQTVWQMRGRTSPSDPWTEEQEQPYSTEFADGVAPDGGISFEWQIRTKGEHPDWSPWSATAVFTVIDRPGVAVTSPETEWDASILPVEWSWLQLQARPQSSWQAELVDSFGDTVETRSGSGAATATTFAHRLAEGDWTVNVRAATGDVWSEWASQTFTVTFDPPAPPLVEGEWDDEQGGVVLTVSVGQGGVAVQGEDGAWYAEFPIDDVSNIGFDEGHPFIEEGADAGLLFDGPTVTVSDVTPPPSVSVTLERSVDGDTWEPVTETAEVSSLIDWESWSYGDIQYRATAFTAEGATSVSTIVVEARSEVLWLSGGVGFGVTCRLPLNPERTFDSGRATSAKQYAGRSRPVVMKGEALSDVHSIAGTVTDHTLNHETASPGELREVIQSPERLHMLRTPDGERVYGAVSGIGLRRNTTAQGNDPLRPWKAFWGYSFQLTEGT